MNQKVTCLHYRYLGDVTTLFNDHIIRFPFVSFCARVQTETMRSVYVHLPLVSLLLLLPITTNAQDSDSRPDPSTPPRESAEDRARDREFERLDTINRESRARALSRLSSTGTLVPDRIDPSGPDLDVVSRNSARQNMMALAAEVQALYDIGGTTTLSADLGEDIESRSETAADMARELLDFVNRGIAPLPADSVSLPEDRYQARSLELVTLYMDILEPTAELIFTDVLDLEKLDRVRSGLATIEALAEALPDSDFDVSLTHTPVP